MVGSRPNERTILAGLCLVAVIAVSCGACSDPDGAPTVKYPELSDAKQLLDTTVRLAKAGDFKGMCKAVAAAEPNCEGLLQSAKDIGYGVDREIPQIVGQTYVNPPNSEPTLVLHLRGVHDDGKEYQSDFAVIIEESGVVKSLTPVYWSGVKFSH